MLQDVDHDSGLLLEIHHVCTFTAALSKDKFDFLFRIPYLCLEMTTQDCSLFTLGHASTTCRSSVLGFVHMRVVVSRSGAVPSCAAFWLGLRSFSVCSKTMIRSR